MQAEIQSMWAEEDERQLIEMRDDGHTYTQIGLVLGRSMDACKTRMKVIRQRESTGHFASRSQRPWTTEDEEILFRMRSEGIPYRIIGVHMERTARSCEKKYQNTDWSFLYQSMTPEDIEEEGEHRVAKAKLREKIYAAQDMKLQAYKLRAEIIADRIVASTESLPKVSVTWKPSRKKQIRTDEYVGVVLSDLHIGAHHTLEETGGISEYNEQVLKKRIENMKMAVMEIVDIHSQVRNLPELHIFCLGDIVAGSNNAGAWSATYINQPIYDQMTRGWKAIADMIYYWLPRFKKITFYGVRGNHGRCAQQGVEKDYCNWDHMSYQFLEATFKDNTNLEFVIPKAWWINTEIMNHSFLLVHGDDVRAGTLPIRGLLNFEAKMAQIIGKYPDYTLAGHFHSAAELTTNSGRVIINGAFVGSDVYSLKSVHSASPPEQKVFGIHPEHGISWTYNINLDHERT